MFSVCQKPIQPLLDCDDVQRTERMLVDQFGHVLDEQASELIVDFCPPPGPDCTFVSHIIDGQHRYIATEAKISSAGSSNFMFFSQLGQLQEYREKLTRAVRSITQELQSGDLLGHNSFVAPPDSMVVGEWDSCLYWTQPHVCAPSLHLPYFGSIHEDVWAYVAIIARKTRLGFHLELSRYKRELRRISAIFALVRKVTSFGISFFCSVRWERRRWFVRHGARPPKETVQATLSLITEACCRSLVAHC
jgi:hypothetical protein